MNKFKSLGIDDKIIKALHEMGFEEPTPIQEQAIPVFATGRDLIGQAQTGTGKTAAFGIPLIEKLNYNSEALQVLVLTPTRELAIQVAEELNKIGQFTNARALPIYGGQDIQRQIKSLQRRPQIIVATPGRLMDHMDRRTIRLSDIKTVIIDEADEMLNMGFVDDIEQILRATPEERQTILFSATMPLPIQNLARRFQKNPALIQVKVKEVTAPLIAQQYIEIPDNKKFDVLCRLLDMQAPELSIIFGRTKRRVDEVTEALKKRGYLADGIHGDLTQSKREIVLRQFRDGVVDILVATDVAARGLDVSGVTHIYNFDIPQDADGYVHRIGRTGRAGHSGLALTMISPQEAGQLRYIQQTTKCRIDRIPVPTMSEAMESQQRLASEKLLQQLQDGNLDPYRLRAEELLADFDSASLLAAALKLMTKEPDNTPVKISAAVPQGIRPSGIQRRRSAEKGQFTPKPKSRNSDWKYREG